MQIIILLASTILDLTWRIHGQEPHYLGSLPMLRPAFTGIMDHGPDVVSPTERYSILIATFELVPDVREDVNLVVHPGKSLSNPSNSTSVILGQQFYWPREPAQIPESTFGSYSYAHITDGFISPGYKEGAIYVADMTDPQNVIVTDISTREDDANPWFYQRATWKDADKDGNLDAFACRTFVQSFPPDVLSEFVWFRHPGTEDAPQTSSWEIGLVISENDCDTYIVQTLLEVDGVQYDVIFTTGYFSNKLSVYWTEDGMWDNLTNVHSRVIDTLILDADCVPGQGLCGHFFDISVEDANLDGRLDLILTISSEVYGSMVVYEIPDDFRNDTFVPITLAEGFIPRINMSNQGAPGLFQTFRPTPETGKPWITLGGDDDGRSYLLVPQNEDPDSWDYEVNILLDGGEYFTMGGSIAFDSDGDGYSELFQCVYSGDEIRFYTFVDVD